MWLQHSSSHLLRTLCNSNKIKLLTEQAETLSKTKLIGGLPWYQSVFKMFFFFFQVQSMLFDLLFMGTKHINKHFVTVSMSKFHSGQKPPADPTSLVDSHHCRIWVQRITAEKTRIHTLLTLLHFVEIVSPNEIDSWTPRHVCKCLYLSPFTHPLPLHQLACLSLPRL